MTRWPELIVFSTLIGFCHSTCLQPYVPENGRVVFTSSSPYSVGSRAKYSCDLGFIHVGPEERTCLDDGTWSDTAPVCAVNLALYKPVTHSVSSYEPDEPATLAVDGVLDGHCILAELTHPESYRWTVDLLHVRPIYAVELLLGDRLNKSTSLTLINMHINVRHDQLQGQSVICTRFHGNIETNVLHTFVCDQSLTARYVTLEVVGTPIKLCEVFVLSTAASSQFQCNPIGSMELLGVHNGECYHQSLVGNSLAWSGAHNTCMQSQSSLAMHIDQPTHQFLRSQLQHRSHSNAQFYWIGLTGDAAAGVWSWADGTQLLNRSFTSWLEQSNAQLQGENVAAAMAQPFDWKWLAVTNNVWNGWICQAPVSVCSSPAVPASGGVMISRQPFHIGTTAFYFCSPGFRLVGASTRKCGDFGTWEGDVPSCHVVECSTISPVAHGKMRLLNGTRLYGSLIQFGCVPGYTFDSQQDITICQADGTWSVAPPQCKPIECASPPRVQHGNMSTNGSRLGSWSRYECAVGYRLVGSDVLTCGPDQIWTPEPPVCYDLNTINQLLSLNNNGTTKEDVSSGFVQWLLVIVGVLVAVMFLLAVALFFAYRRSKRLDGVSVGTLYTTAGNSNLAYASSNSSAGTNNDYADIYVNNSQLHINAHKHMDAIIDAQHLQIQQQYNSDSMTQIVLPARLLNLDSNTQNATYLVHTRPANGHGTLKRVGSLPKTLKRSPSAIDKQSTIRYKRPAKFQTMVSRVRQRLSILDTDTSKPEQTRTRPEIVLVGLQASSRNLSVYDTAIRPANGSSMEPAPSGQRSPTPSELMYSFQDADDYDSAEDERPVEKSAINSEHNNNIQNATDNNSYVAANHNTSYDTRSHNASYDTNNNNSYVAANQNTSFDTSNNSSTYGTTTTTTTNNTIKANKKLLETSQILYAIDKANRTLATTYTDQNEYDDIKLPSRIQSRSSNA